MTGKFLKKKLDKGNSFIYNLCELRMFNALRSQIIGISYR